MYIMVNLQKYQIKTCVNALLQYRDKNDLTEEEQEELAIILSQLEDCL